MKTEKMKCKCGKMATWIYMPNSANDHPFYCDDCVSRGCSCNYYFVKDDRTPDGAKNVDWKWVVTDDFDEPIAEGECYVYLDDKQREYPCCEFEYDEEGFDVELWKD